MPAYAVTNPAGTPIDDVQRDPDGNPCTFFMLMPDGSAIAANSRTGILMEVVSDYRTLVEMAEIVETEGRDGVNRLFDDAEYAATAEALIDEGEEDDPDLVVEVLDSVMYEYRRQFLGALANDLQAMVALTIQRELEAMGSSLDDLDEDFLSVLFFDRANAAIDFEGGEWTHRWPLYLLATSYAPLDEDGPLGPVGDRVIWLDPTTETTFLDSCARIGFGELMLLDEDVQFEMEEIL